MTDRRQDNSNDRELWARLVHPAPQGDAGGPCLEASELAAYLDGRTGADRVARVEAHLAACDQCLAAVREARQLLDQPAMPAPAALVGSAKALVAAETPARALRGGWLGRAVGRTSWQGVARWAAATAAAILVGFAGFSAGSATVHDRQTADAKVAAEISFESFMPTEDPLTGGENDLDMLLENGGVK